MMSFKGQAVNIDWTVGLALFVVSMVTGITIVSSMGAVSLQDFDQQAAIIHSNLQDETYIRGGQVSLLLSSPVEIEKIPVDSKYVFDQDVFPGSGSMDIPAEINVTGNRIVAVLDAHNGSHRLNYFYSDNSNLSYQDDNDLSVSTNWLNNSELSISPGGSGIESIKHRGEEKLSGGVDLENTGSSTVENELYASSLDGDLKIYNGSREFILENATANTEWALVNFTEIYWHADEETYDLSDVEPKSGETAGFTLASPPEEDHGITFIGDLYADVERIDDETVKAGIEADRLRVFLHDSGIGQGIDRLRFHDEGLMTFGVSKPVEGAGIKGIEELGNTTENVFENRLGIEVSGYNVGFGPWRYGFVEEKEDWEGTEFSFENLTGSLQGWNSVVVDADVSEGVSVEAEFESISGGNAWDSQSFEVDDGRNRYFLSVEDSPSYRLSFNSSSEVSEGNWQVNEFEVEYGPLLKRGQEPPEENVIVSNVPSLKIDRFGNRSIVENRVAVWN